MSLTRVVLADIGNSCIKLSVDSKQLTSITEKQPIVIELPEINHQWFVCSVSPSATERLQEWVSTNRPNDSFYLIQHSEVLLQIELDSPTQVGLDRLMAATAASQMTPSDAVVIDAGTALTVDAVSQSRFLGGTISPGIETEFGALRTNAEQLPLVDQFQVPESVIGKSTDEAIRAGVLLGQVGAIIYLANLIAEELTEPQFIATGGGLAPIASRLPPTWRVVPDLVHRGMQVTTDRILAAQRVD